MSTKLLVQTKILILHLFTLMLFSHVTQAFECSCLLQ